MRVELNLARHPLTVEAGWFFGYLGHVQVVYMDGRVDDDSYARYVEAVRVDIDDREAREERTPVFYHIPQPAALTAHRRAMLAKVLKEKENAFARHTAGYAMVTTSSMVRYGLRVLFWLAPPPYPNAVLATPREGFEFLARYDDSLDPLALTARYQSLLTQLMSHGAFELLGAAKKRDLPVHPLPVREQTVPDGDAPGVDRAEPHPSGCRRRSARHQVGVALHWISREGRIWGPGRRSAGATGR